MSYKNALPFFPEEDIDNILLDVKKILSGGGFLTKGPKVKEFEKIFAEYTGTKYAIATNSCTSALEIVLKAIGLTTSDEVIVPTQTFVATGASVVTAGGKVVFCDSDENFLLDFEDLKKKITKHTRAVILVHFAGLIHPKIQEIKQLLKQKNIYLIEDCAHSSGAKIDTLFAGNLGDFGCHSFYSTKVITTGEGGMITLNDDDFYHTCSSIRSIGIDTKTNAEIFLNVGSNNRMAEFEAILGISQINRLEEFVEHRLKIAKIYKEQLHELEARGVIRYQNFPKNIRHPYWKFVVFITSDKYAKDDLKTKFLNHGINIEAPYQPLMHLQPVFKKLYDTKEGDMPKSEALSQSHFCLPIHAQISETDALNISNIVKKVFE